MVALALRKHFDLLLENHMDLNAVISLLLMCIYYKHSWRPPPHIQSPPCKAHNYTVQTEWRILAIAVCPCSFFAQWLSQESHLPSSVKGASSLAVLCPSDRVPGRLRHPGNMKRSRAEMSAGCPICQSVGW